MSTKMCRKVVAAPHNTGKHVSRMVLVPGMRATDGYVLSSSGNYLSLQKLPLTGAPRLELKQLRKLITSLILPSQWLSQKAGEL